MEPQLLLVRPGQTSRQIQQPIEITRASAHVQLLATPGQQLIPVELPIHHDRRLGRTPTKPRLSPHQPLQLQGQQTGSQGGRRLLQQQTELLKGGATPQGF